MDPKDHDLLIELRTEVKSFREEFRNSDKNVAAQLGNLQSVKLDKEEFVRHIASETEIKLDHESRIRALEKGFFRTAGALAAIQIIVQVALSFASHLFK
jgi:hypothetical protein